jgi:putative CGCGG family rSAM target protein
MATTDDPDHDHDHDGVDSVTDRVHDNSWSADLEGPDHAVDRNLVLAHAREAVEHTTAGNHVNLVTHGNHGHPQEYLYDLLAGLDVEYEYVEQCGCGGHVTRAHVR